MDLTVQEIIAKVALRKHQETYQQQKKQMIDKICSNHQQTTGMIIYNNKTRQKHPTTYHKHSSPSNITTKNKINPQIYLSLGQDSQITQNQSILEQKYKRLQFSYKKLKSKLNQQAKIQEQYGQVLKKLQIVLSKNNKIQKDLNLIRSKKQIFTQKSQLKNSQKSHQSSSGFVSKFQSIEQRQKNKKSNKSKFTSLSQQRNDIYCGKNTQAKQQKNKQAQLQIKQSINNKNEFVDNLLLFQESNKVQNVWIKEQIQRYRSLIIEKQSQIVQLKEMAQKQQEIIKNYSKICITSQPSEQVTNKAKINEKKSDKIEGTIMKVKRNKRKQQQTKQSEQLTDRNFTNMNKKNNHHLGFQQKNANETKTKKKFQQTNKHNRNLRENSIDVQVSQYIREESPDKSYTNQQRDQYQQQQMNQTSEFICEI